MKYIRLALNKILSLIQTTEGVIGTAGVLATTLLIFADVLNRYWLRFEIMGIGDLALYFFIFFMLVAAALTTWREGHVAVDFLRERMMKKSPLMAAAYRVFLVILSLLILALLLPEAYKFMLTAVKYPEYGTLIRWFNQSWLQITFFVALVFVAIHLVIIAKRDIVDLIKNLIARSNRGKA